MDNITHLSQIDFKQLFIWIILLLVAIKFLIELFGGTIGKLLKKLDIETKTMREKREQRELLTTTAKLAKTTAENLDKLQKRHTKDEEDFRNNLNNYMAESRADRKVLHDEMKQFSVNRVNDRQQSLQIQKELKDSIKGLIDGQQDRDSKIENLTSLFVDKEIDDYRWEIINFATKVSEGGPCNKDSFKHCLRTYEKYEALLEKYGLENGEVEISMEVVNEAYKKKLLEGF